MGEIERKVKISPSLGKYLEQGKQNEWFVASDSKQRGEVWMGAVAGTFTDKKWIRDYIEGFAVS